MDYHHFAFNPNLVAGIDVSYRGVYLYTSTSRSTEALAGIIWDEDIRLGHFGDFLDELDHLNILIPNNNIRLQ